MNFGPQLLHSLNNLARNLKQNLNSPPVSLNDVMETIAPKKIKI